MLRQRPQFKEIYMSKERPSYLPDGVHDDPENRAFWEERAKNKAKLRKMAIITIVVCGLLWLVQSL